jgi:uncharacterized membrane protein
MRFVRALLAACVVAMAVAPAVLAQGPLEMSTTYPSVTADPGATVKFTVKVTTDTAQRVDLTVTSQPEGWGTRLTGAGSTIGALTTSANPDVAGEISGLFTVEVDVPATVAAGSNQVVIQGRTASGTTAQLALDVVTEEQQAGSVSMAADAPNLRGATTANFRFNLKLKNDTNTQQTFSLDTEAPAGWTVEAKPTGDELAATAVVDAGSQTTIQVTAKAPADEAAGQYPIVVHATSGALTADAQLTVEITGSYSMTLDTSDSRLNARVSAGAPTTLNLIIQNTGTAPLTNVTLTSSPPSSWKVTFDPSPIDSIAPGDQATTVATITAAGDALAGDYVIAFSANSDSASDRIEVRTTVETSPIGYLIGIAILIAVGVGLFVVFQRYGRR